MIVVHVPGMDCRQRVRAVSARVSDVPGVQTVEVDLDARSVRVTGPADPAAVAAAVGAADCAVVRCAGAAPLAAPAPREDHTQEVGPSGRPGPSASPRRSP